MRIRIILIGLVALSWVMPVEAAGKDRIIIDTPPASLGQWYKPQNKRQVWLHTMFRLRRSMQAVEEYAQTGDRAATEKWARKLEQDYEKLAELVPEWEDEIKPALLPELMDFIEDGDTGRVEKTLHMINRTCKDCHRKYQAQVAAIYRAPSYDGIEVSGSTQGKISFQDSMEELSRSVNRILIFLEDGNYIEALRNRTTLITQLQGLGASCTNCHQDSAPHDRILGAETTAKLEQLKEYLERREVKNAQKMMGEFAVNVCARCHGTHRTLSDLRQKIIKAAASN